MRPIKLTVEYVHDPSALEAWFRLLDALLRVDLRRYSTSETALTTSDLRDDGRKAGELVQVPLGGPLSYGTTFPAIMPQIKAKSRNVNQEVAPMSIDPALELKIIRPRKRFRAIAADFEEWGPRRCRSENESRNKPRYFADLRPETPSEGGNSRNSTPVPSDASRCYPRAILANHGSFPQRDRPGREGRSTAYRAPSPRADTPAPVQQIRGGLSGGGPL